MNGFVKFGRVPIADEQHVLFGAFKVKHHFKAVFGNLAQHAACGARTTIVFEEGFVKFIEHIFNGLIQHAIAQKLIVANLEQRDV